MQWKTTLTIRWVEENVHGMSGLIEEHLNAYSHYKNNQKFAQSDLLIPVKNRIKLIRFLYQ